MKLFNTNTNIGKAKYVVSSHDGIKKHTDGSMFFDIQIFKNKKDFIKYQKELEADGYLYGDCSFKINESNLEKCYSVLNENELEENCAIISKKIDDRFGPICSGLDISVAELQMNTSYSYIGNRTVEWFVFGIKDKFETIEKYLCEIIDDGQYKEFIKLREMK